MKKNQAKQLLITSDVEGQRIDNFLMRQLGRVPKSRVYQMIRKGEVRVNKGRVKQTYKLLEGDSVRIPPIYLEERSQPIITDDKKRRILEAIVYEDSSMLIINKPAGLSVHSGSNQPTGVIEIFRQASDEYKKLELVHRLDKDTSGCLMLAKDRKSLRHLHHAIQHDEIKKTYLTLLAGRIDKKTTRVDKPLSKEQTNTDNQRVSINNSGKKAVTVFHLQKKFEHSSLMEVELLTGRTHQIRVHSAYLGHPILGDNKYGDKASNQAFRKLGLRRLFLHASQLNFVSPATGNIQHVNAPLDQQLELVLSKLS